MVELLIELSTLLLRIASIVLIGLLTKYGLPWLTNTVVPWLKEKRLYSLICYFVRAAEKLAETGALEKCNKKDYVIKLLEMRGIAVTKDISAMIESAVLDLDLAAASVWDKIYDALLEDEIKMGIEVDEAEVKAEANPAPAEDVEYEDWHSAREENE